MAEPRSTRSSLGVRAVSSDDQAARIQAALARIERAFRKRWDNNPDFRRSLKGKDRDILIDLNEAGSWHLIVRDGELTEIREGHLDKPNVRIHAEAEDFLAIFDGTLSPVDAYLKKKIKVKAGLRDILLVKAFMGG